ncbi:MAG: hypothetical protein PHU53_01915 [Thermoplasmata archaeon]|nr:hypothetical protein [Thermoplasmata archaeon]
MPNDLRLKVIASSIDGKGVAKLDADSYRALRLGEGTPVTVTYGTKSCELMAKQDSIFSQSTVRLMKADMEALRVEEGMPVTVSKKKGSRLAESDSAPKGKGKKRSKGNAASLDRF